MNEYEYNNMKQEIDELREKIKELETKLIINEYKNYIDFDNDDEFNFFYNTTTENIIRIEDFHQNNNLTNILIKNSSTKSVNDEVNDIVIDELNDSIINEIDDNKKFESMILHEINEYIEVLYNDKKSIYEQNEILHNNKKKINERIENIVKLRNYLIKII